MIDVEELICELHHIAGTESVDADIRRTACDAESALASLRAWVNELQMNVAERKAIEWAILTLANSSSARVGVAMDNVIAAQQLRKLLERLG